MSSRARKASRHVELHHFGLGGVLSSEAAMDEKLR